MRWTFHQTGKPNTAFSYPRRFVRACCKFIKKEKNIEKKNVSNSSLFLQAISLCILYQSLPENFPFLIHSQKPHSKKASQLIPTRRPNHTLFSFIYTAFSTSLPRNPDPVLISSSFKLSNIAFPFSLAGQMRSWMWVFALLSVYAFAWSIGADQNVRTERISGFYISLLNCFLSCLIVLYLIKLALLSYIITLAFEYLEVERDYMFVLHIEILEIKMHFCNI